jgi:hypothetical protein
MTWSRLTLLCAPPELTVWLEACMERFDLVPLLFSTSTSPGIIQPEGSLPADGELSRVVLLPRADAPAGTVPAGQVRSLERGWLEVRPGAHLQHPDGGVLLVSEFLAPTRPASPNTPVAWLRWLSAGSGRTASVSACADGMYAMGVRAPIATSAIAQEPSVSWDRG